MSEAHPIEHGDGNDDAVCMCVDVVGVRMRCLELALMECKDNPMGSESAVMVASNFAAFVLDGATPAKHN